MPTVGVTGGIATGKSTFARLLVQGLSAEFFDADQAAHDLLARDAAVRRSVEEQFGSDIYQDGSPDRRKLREIVFASAERRRELEGILHPVIRQRWETCAAEVSSSGAWLVVEIPLLYETAAESKLDRVVVVACAPATQRDRLRTQRGLDDSTANRIIAAQLDLEIKIKRADHLIWNDGAADLLQVQTDLLQAWLQQNYG